MGRGKVKLNLIKDQSQRNNTYQTRKQGLKKKAQELSTLCNIPVLAICIDPSTGEIDSFTCQDATDIMAIYLKSNQKTQENNRFDLPRFLKDEIRKLESELKNSRVEELQLLDSKISSVNERVQGFDNEKRERIAFWRHLLRESRRQQDYPPKIFSGSTAEYYNGALMVRGLNTFALNSYDSYSNFGQFGDLGLDLMQNHPSNSTMNPPENSIGVSYTSLSTGNADGVANYNNFGDFSFGLLQNHPLASADGFNTFTMNPSENSTGFSDSNFLIGNADGESNYIKFGDLGLGFTQNHHSIRGDGQQIFAMNSPENSSRISGNHILMGDGDGEANYGKFGEFGDLGLGFMQNQSSTSGVDA